MWLDELDESYRTMYYGLSDYAEPEQQKKGIHDVRRFTCYPPYPWKLNDTDHFADNPRTFWEACLNAGMVRNVRKEDIETRYSEPITYQQWLERHKDEPGFVNHMEDGGMRKL